MLEIWKELTGEEGPLPDEFRAENLEAGLRKIRGEKQKEIDTMLRNVSIYMEALDDCMATEADTDF